MVQSERYGVLVMAGRPMTAGDIAKSAGYPRRTVEPLIRELTNREVCSVDTEGCIYSRRLVRDWAQSEIDCKNGTRGGNTFKRLLISIVNLIRQVHRASLQMIAAH